MRAAISPIMRFSSAEFNGLDLFDDGHELEFEDAMYDIVAIRPQNDSVVVRAVRDDEETRLAHDLDRLIRAELCGNEGEEEEGSGGLAPWAPFHEAWRRIGIGTVPDAQRHFCVSRQMTGRDDGLIDPGPPRKG